VRWRFHAVHGPLRPRRLAPLDAVEPVRVRRVVPVLQLALLVAEAHLAAPRACHVVHVELAAGHALAELL